MKVEHHDTEDDREGDQDHGDHQVVDNNRNTQRGFRDFVGQQKQEDSQSQQYINRKTHLLP